MAIEQPPLKLHSPPGTVDRIMSEKAFRFIQDHSPNPLPEAMPFSETVKILLDEQE